MWYSRFLLFRDMGPVRTMIGALRLEDKATGRQEHKGITGSWREAAIRFRWRERVEAWDVYRRQEVFTQGYAYDLARIQKLDELAQKLVARTEAMLANMKPSKGGFQEFLYRAMLDTFEALAAETGGRKAKMELTGADGGPLVEAQRVVFFAPELMVGNDIDLTMPVPVEGGSNQHG